MMHHLSLMLPAHVTMHTPVAKSLPRNILQAAAAVETSACRKSTVCVGDHCTLARVQQQLPGAQYGQAVCWGDAAALGEIGS